MSADPMPLTSWATPGTSPPSPRPCRRRPRDIHLQQHVQPRPTLHRQRRRPQVAQVLQQQCLGAPHGRQRRTGCAREPAGHAVGHQCFRGATPPDTDAQGARALNGAVQPSLCSILAEVARVKCLTKLTLCHFSIRNPGK
ncbi:hypothetical protein PVAP13_6NG210903 [Panicum virgatum]|uniref:Uncharacterized protein n=1 Tax=Panicum virgatum TaxID=38727 RepID=A0A8T0QX52_PANVG|nr:hypothetical protein PVAP13_6NG210903 [Panicum virgatum]